MIYTMKINQPSAKRNNCLLVPLLIWEIHKHCSKSATFIPEECLYIYGPEGDNPIYILSYSA